MDRRAYRRNSHEMSSTKSKSKDLEIDNSDAYKTTATSKWLQHTDNSKSEGEGKCLEHNSSVKRAKHLCKVLFKHRGILWAFLSALMASLTSLVMKFISGRVSVNQIVSFRSMVFVFASSPMLLWQKISLGLSTKIWMILALRGLLGTASTTCYFYAYQLLDISIAKSITYSSPLFTVLFACLCLKERCSVPTTLFSVLTIVGVVLVVQPRFLVGDVLGEENGNNSLVGSVFALGAAIFISLSLVILRVLGKFKIHAQIVLFTFGCIGTVVSPIMTSALNEWTNPRCELDRLLVLTVCALSYLEWMMVTIAVQSQNAATVAVIRASDVFITFLLDFLVFGVIPNILTIIGALCVVASSVGVTLYSHLSSHSQDDAEG